MTDLIESKEDATPPDKLPLLTLTDQVVFPGSVVPIRLSSKSEVRLVTESVGQDRYLGLVTLREKRQSEGEARVEDAYEIGTIGRVLQFQQLPDASISVVIQAIERFRIDGELQREPYIIVRVEHLVIPKVRPRTLAPLLNSVRIEVSRLIKLSPNIPDAAISMIENIDDPGFLADLIAGNLNVPLHEKQKILATLSVHKRLERLLYLLAREIDLMEASNKIHDVVQNTIDKSQREYFLRAQLKAIQDELGESEEDRPELLEYREKLEALNLPEDARKEAFRELERLTRMHEASAEYHVITTYLEWIIDLPWHIATKDCLDIRKAEHILDADHYGLEKVKDRILDYLAVRKLKPDATGPILCFVGPPGVGKTSLGKSIAGALGREYIRMSLGGMRDEAEIRGHRRTYVGAMPGRVIQSIRKAQTCNPVIVLDEIDKVGSDFRGDPSSALLEVLDPAQNDTFTDHYLSVAFDLSRVLFIATANVLDTIPWALRDRMEVIQIPGYTQEEKVQIARRYLVPKQIEAHGISSRKLIITAAAIRKIIGTYTREAGVRNLDREIANLCRRAARLIASGRRKPLKVDPDDLHDLLGKERISQDVVERTQIPGISIGLAWTATGGDILFIEATRMPGEGKLILTGQLGDVMKESAQAVLSYVRSNSALHGIEPDAFKQYDIHIHVPQGAVPKDGPSAGITILTAIVSLFTGKKVKSRLAMTGETTLRGLVLPVGGIKEKVLAAARAGIKEIILPTKNAVDLEDIPESIRKKLRFHPVAELEEVLRIALGQ